MGQAIPRQQPAVVLRSHFNHLRALLAVALIAVAGLTVAVVILANDSDESAGTSAAKPPIGSINYGDSKYVDPSTGFPTAAFPQLEQAQAGVTPETEMKDEAGTAAAIGQASVSPETEMKDEAGTAAAIGQAGVTPETEMKDEAGTAAAIGQSNGDSELRGSKTDPQGPASLLP
jgi:hypothetical protein